MRSELVPARESVSAGKPSISRENAETDKKHYSNAGRSPAELSCESHIVPISYPDSWERGGQRGLEAPLRVCVAQIVYEWK